MKLKKLMSLGLALVMALALTVPALATTPNWDADEHPDEQQTTFTGGTTAPTLKVAVLGSAALVFNPYKLEAKMTTSGVLNTGTANNDDVTVSDQIISKAFEIQNQTNVPIRMGVILGAKAANSVDGAEVATIAKSAPAASVTAKQVWVYADFAVFDGTAAQLDKRPEAWLTAQRLTATEATVASDGTWDGTSGGKMEVKAGAGGIYVPKPTVPASANGTDYQNSIWVKLGGAATPTPTNTWSTTDTLNVYMALKFVTLGSAQVYKLRAGATDSSATTISVSPVAFAATADGANSTPTFTIPSRAADLAVGWAVTTEGSEAIWEADETTIVGDFEAGTVVTIHAPKNQTTGNANFGKKGEVSNIVFYNVDGTKNTSVKATQTNTKDKTSDWTFTMPAQHIYVMMTVKASDADASS